MLSRSPEGETTAGLTHAVKSKMVPANKGHASAINLSYVDRNQQRKGAAVDALNYGAKSSAQPAVKGPNIDSKWYKQKRKLRKNNSNLKTHEDLSPPKIQLNNKRGDAHQASLEQNPQHNNFADTTTNNNKSNNNEKFIQLEGQQVPQGQGTNNTFLSNISTNQTLAGIVKVDRMMDSHRLSKLTSKMGDRNMKSSMMLVSKETIQTNKLTKLQSSRAVFNLGKSTLDSKLAGKQNAAIPGNASKSQM